MEPTIYLAPSEPTSDIVAWLLEKKEAPVRTVYVPMQGIKEATPPYYTDGYVLIREFWSLIEFLQERYPGEQLMPIDPVVRAQMRQACRDIFESVDLWPDLEEILATGTPYLAGKEFTIVDLFAGVWMKHGGIEHVNPGVVLNYYHRIGKPA